MYYYYLFICALFLGFFRLPFPSIVNDIFFAPLLIFSFINRRRLRYSNKNTRYFVFSWIALILYNSILLVISDSYYSEITPFLNIRGVYPFFLLFITTIIIDTKQDLYRFVKFLLYASAVATVFSILQSIHGLEPMFNPQKFYDIGHWPGQGDILIGSIARVMLPTIYLIYIIFISLILYSFINGKIKYLPFLIILLTPIMISYARSMWFSIAISILLTLIILIFKKSLPFKKNLILVFLFILILATTIMVFNDQNNIYTSIVERINSGLTDYNSKSGTYSIRIINSAKFSALWYSKGFYFGIDPLYMYTKNEPSLSDVGYVYVLVTTGIIGLILLVNLWISAFNFSLFSINKGIIKNQNVLISSGAILFSFYVFLICSQIYTQYSYTTSLNSIICGLSISVRRLWSNE